MKIPLFAIMAILRQVKENLFAVETPNKGLWNEGQNKGRQLVPKRSILYPIFFEKSLIWLIFKNGGVPYLELPLRLESQVYFNVPF